MTDSPVPTSFEVNRPFMMSFFMYCTYAGIIFMPVIYAILLFSKGGSFYIDETRVTQEEFRQHIYDYALFLAATWAYFVFAAEGIRRNKPWTRPLLMGGAVASSVLSIDYTI